MLPDISSVIRNANIIWNMMYYDELITKQNYQLSIVYAADRDYYNCAHDIKKLTSETLNTIQEYYHKNKLPAAIYIEPTSQQHMVPTLTNAGYQLIPEEQENWYYFDLQNLTNTQNVDPKVTISTQQINVNTEPKDFVNFLKINASVNNIPIELVKKFQTKAQQSAMFAPAKNYYYLSSVDGKPASTRTIGINNNMGFLAEGATITEFKRKGIYSSMMYKILQFTKQQNCRFIFVNCDSTAFSNQACLKFGFQFYFQRNLYKGKAHEYYK